MAKDWERKLKRELQHDTLKEFENWTSAQFIFLISQLREQIDLLKSKPESKAEKNAGGAQKQPLNERMFRQDWSYPTKIHFLLALRQRPLTSGELDADLLKLDSHYKDYNSPQKNLSVHLNRAAKSGRINRIKIPGIKSLYFSLPDWMNADKTLKESFRRFVSPF